MRYRVVRLRGWWIAEPTEILWGVTLPVWYCNTWKQAIDAAIEGAERSIAA
jgi:hypothetical protein